jgi:hypothetical protein
MRKRTEIGRKVCIVTLLALALAAGAAQAQPCVVNDNGTGTVTLPPAGCNYLSPNQVHLIINGLPPGTQIILDPIHRDFICRSGGGCNTPGGSLGGEIETFGSALTLRLSGTGMLAGWSRTITLPARCETHTGPRTPGNPVQSFAAEMVRLEGTITGDPDFDYLHVVAGTANGYPSPGSTTLTRLPSGQFQVDSQFTINYRIDFKGTAGGKLKGMGGSTEGSVNMRAYSGNTTSVNKDPATK